MKPILQQFYKQIPFTDKVLTINDGTISKLNNPVNNKDAANKQYVEEYVEEYVEAHGTSPGKPDRSIQFNDNGSFAGSENLLYQEDPFVNSITSGLQFVVQTADISDNSRE